MNDKKANNEKQIKTSQKNDSVPFMRKEMVEVSELEDNYEVYSSKLVKFRESKLKAVKFTQSGSRGKLLITFD